MDLIKLSNAYITYVPPDQCLFWTIYFPGSEIETRQSIVNVLNYTRSSIN